ncbi:MAG: hypothetical protein GX794_03755, partial [Acholeplasmataceae bacterium]|nr:hypothetical protein [Acholeplasmataceae bacterium]
NLEKARDKSDVSKTLAEYAEALNKKTKQYNEEREIVLELNKSLKAEADYLDKLFNLIPDQAFKNYVKYYRQNEDNLNVHELTNYLNLVAGSVASYQKSIYNERQNLELEKINLSTQLRDAKIRLQDLKRNVKTYPAYVNNLVNAINRELTYKFNKEVNVKPLADLIEVNDEAWRNALEGYLNTQRFDIIVEPELFDSALEVYEKVKQELKIYGVGLVNTAKLGNYLDDAKEASLASKVTSDHIYARRYVNMLLNGITCVYHINDLKNFDRAITTTGMTYSNYTARQINPRIYEVPFIGDGATERQIEIQTEDLEALELEMARLYNETEENEQANRLLNRSDAYKLINQNNLRFFNQVKNTRKEMAMLEEQYNSLALNPDVQKLEEEIDNEKNRRRQLRLDNEKVISVIANARDERTRVLESIDNIKIKLDEFMDAQKELALKNPEVLAVSQTQFHALKQKTKEDYNKISQDIASSNTTIRTQNSKLDNDLTNQMRAYIHNYSFGKEPNIESLIYFEQEANLIKNQNLIKYEIEATELRKASEASFKEDFVNKLRASIENAQQQIEELNFALKGKKFGTDQYQLVYSPSLDPEYKLYYNIIMSVNADSHDTLFTESLSKKNERILMELFEKISSDNPEYDRLAYEFLDYRNYMSYDIEIKNANGNISFFSKVSREKSGGETQVPFYIVIAASFQQLLSRNKRIDSGCVVLFDEAFNNMDESRIEAMMKFYNSLSIQLLISVPPQRVSNIIPYVNTSLIIVKHDDYAIVESFKDEREVI